MGMCKPSCGVERFVGRLGDLKTKGKPNSRADLYNKNGEKIQSRWYDADGKVTHNRDYKLGGKGPFPTTTNGRQTTTGNLFEEEITCRSIRTSFKGEKL